MRPYSLLAALPLIWAGATSANETEVSAAGVVEETYAYEAPGNATDRLREEAAEIGTDTSEYFESDNFMVDDFGVYDEDFDWVAEDTWYDDWNDADTMAWNDVGDAELGVLGVDDAGSSGLFDF